MEALRAWLDAFGDVITASASMFADPDTIRYRIRRVTEVRELDFRDPSARFPAMLQLRLMGMRATEGVREHDAGSLDTSR